MHLIDNMGMLQAESYESIVLCLFYLKDEFFSCKKKKHLWTGFSDNPLITKCRFYHKFSIFMDIRKMYRVLYFQNCLLNICLLNCKFSLLKAIMEIIFLMPNI